jgi:hypothetical protein
MSEAWSSWSITAIPEVKCQLALMEDHLHAQFSGLLPENAAGYSMLLQNASATAIDKDL